MKPLSVLAIAALTTATGFMGGWLARVPQAPPAASANLPATPPSSFTGERPDRRIPTGNDPAGIMRDAKPGRPQEALAKAMKQALDHPLEGKRIGRWMKLLELMRPEDAPAIQALLQEEAQAGRALGPETTAFWQAWAALDGDGAWAFAEANARTGGQQGAEALLKAWSMSDPARASEVVASLKDSPLAQQAIAGLLHGLAESNPTAAIAFANSRLPAEYQEIAAVHITGSMISRYGNKEAQTWFDGLPADVSPIYQKETARVLMESLSRAEPGAVEKFALERLAQPWAARPDEQQFTAIMIARNGGSPWDYVGAATEKNPNAEDPLFLARQTALREPDGATAWIDAHPDHPAADEILAGTAQALTRRGRLEEAAALLARIKDPAILQEANAANTGG